MRKARETKRRLGLNTLLYEATETVASITARTREAKWRKTWTLIDIPKIARGAAA